jgi:hypothetical protein
MKEFPYKPKYLMNNRWVLGKKFKTRASDDYPTNLLRPPYQYVVVMLCKLYGDPDAQKFKVSLVHLIHSITTTGSIFTWADILTSTLAEAISTTKHMALEKHPSFHMASYLLNIMCVICAYPRMG